MGKQDGKLPSQVLAKLNKSKLVSACQITICPPTFRLLLTPLQSTVCLLMSFELCNFKESVFAKKWNVWQGPTDIYHLTCKNMINGNLCKLICLARGSIQIQTGLIGRSAPSRSSTSRLDGLNYTRIMKRNQNNFLILIQSSLTCFISTKVYIFYWQLELLKF